LRDLAGGNLSTEVRLRKNDELQSLADSINRLILNLRSMSQENRAHIETLKETLRSFESELNSQPFDMIKARLLASKMSDMCKELEASLKKHRLNED
jgi:methyl-accepting chemotaxis protein